MVGRSRLLENLVLKQYDGEEGRPRAVHNRRRPAGGEKA